MTPERRGSNKYEENEGAGGVRRSRVEVWRIEGEESQVEGNGGVGEARAARVGVREDGKELEGKDQCPFIVSWLTERQ